MQLVRGSNRLPGQSPAWQGQSLPRWLSLATGASCLSSSRRLLALKLVRRQPRWGQACAWCLPSRSWRIQSAQEAQQKQAWVQQQTVRVVMGRVPPICLGAAGEGALMHCNVVGLLWDTVPCKLRMQPMSLTEAARGCLGGSLAGAGGTVRSQTLL